MSVSLRLSAISRLACAAGSALWLCCAGSAWAGDGGSSGISLQGVLDDVCGFIAGTPGTTPPWCPQLPTVTQQVIEIAGLSNESPDIVRVINSVCTPPGCPQVAVNAVNGLEKPPPGQATDALWYLTPLAFTPGSVATQYGDPAAKSFFYAHVLAGANGQPGPLDVFYDYTAGTNKLSFLGQVPVTLSLPLVVLNKDGSETPVSATLNAACSASGFCLGATVSGTFPGVGKRTFPAGALGVSFDFDVGPSPNSPVPHPVVEVQVPIVMTTQNDPAYFATSACPSGGNPISGYCNAFSQQGLGFPAQVLGRGVSVGITPYAAPPCTATTCPSTTPPIPPTYFGFCASFSNNPVIAAFASVGTDGTTYASTPTPGAGSTTQCPPQN